MPVGARYHVRTAFDSFEVSVRRFLSVSTIALAGLLTVGGSVTVVGDAIPASAATTVLPTVTGGFGTVPTLKFPNVSAPKGLTTKVLSTGRGAKIVKGELLVANYLGQIWRGKVFDSSFSRSETVGFAIGVGQVVKGWDEALVGQRLGSRVLLSIPPTLGYGTAGNTSAGIKGTDTIVFVIDLVAAYPSSVGLREGASVVTTSIGGITVKNIVSTKPSLTVAKSVKKPTAESVKLLAKGTGQKVVPGMLVLQFVVADWTGKSLQSTWTVGSPDGEYVGMKAIPNPFDALVGTPIGSRVLVELPANTNGGPYALVAQIAAEVPAKASKP
jgi:peptidylprolyl isomerase